MMGASKYQTRTELLAAKKSGIAPEVTGSQQFIFDKGHAAEACARPIVEKLIGEELYPIVGTDGNLLASLDGATAEVNDAIHDDYAVVNSDPFGAGWLFAVEVDEVGPLMTAAEYAAANGI